MPIDLAKKENKGFGWYLDDLRPTLTVNSPRPGENDGPITKFRVGFADGNSGIKPNSLFVTLSIPMNGVSPGGNLANQFVQVNDGVYEMTLGQALPASTELVFNAKVADKEGNITEHDVTFYVSE